MKKSLFLLPFALVIFLAACDKNKCDTEGVTYNGDIKAIFDKSCAAVAGCHTAADAGVAPGLLNNYVNAAAFAAGGRMKGAINHQASFSAMPKGGTKLSDCEIDKIEAWIDTGLPQ